MLPVLLCKHGLEAIIATIFGSDLPVPRSLETLLREIEPNDAFERLHVKTFCQLRSPVGTTF